jgi:hypothetical protein
MADLDMLMDLALEKGKKLLNEKSSAELAKEEVKQEPKKSYPVGPQPGDKEFVGPTGMNRQDIIKYILNNPEIQTKSAKYGKVSVIGSIDYNDPNKPWIKEGMDQTINNLLQSKEFNKLSAHEQTKVLMMLGKESTFGTDTQDIITYKKDPTTGKLLLDKKGKPIKDTSVPIGTYYTKNNPAKVSHLARAERKVEGDLSNPDVYLPAVLPELTDLENPKASEKDLEEDAWNSYVVYNKGHYSQNDKEKKPITTKEALQKRAKEALQETGPKSKRLKENEYYIRKYYPALKSVMQFNKTAQGKPSE